MDSFDLALNYLTYKSRTEKEVRDYLKKKKISKKIIEETINKLIDYKYLDDSKYVKQYYELNQIGNKYGHKRLRFNLEKKGINEENLKILDDLISEDEEEEYCRFHFKKLLKITQNLPYNKKVQRINSNLNSKGFSYHIISRFISEIPKNEKIEEVIFLDILEKTINKFKRKGYKNFDLKNRIIKSLLGKGYSYSLIKDHLDDFM